MEKGLSNEVSAQSVENLKSTKETKLDGSTNLDGAFTIEAYEYMTQTDDWDLKDFEALESRLYK